MSTYNVHELLERFHDIYESGFKFCEISIIDSDDEFPESISVDACDEYECIGYEPIDSCNQLSDDAFPLPSPDVPCFDLLFSYREIETIENSIINTLDYIKFLEKQPDCSREIRDKMKSDTVKLKNLQAKFKKFHKDTGISTTYV